MKTATVIVRLTKDHHVTKHNVTPMEAFLLAAAHNIGSKGDPLEVVAGTEHELKEPRTEDQELDRLKRIYPGAIVGLFKEVRELPKEFKDAVERGKKQTMPGGALASQPAASVISQTTVK